MSNITFVLNFGHPIRQDALDQIPKPYEILNISCQLHLEANASMTPIDVKQAIDRAAFLMERYNARLDGTTPVIVVLPSVSDAVGILLAMLHGRLGYFPRIMVFRRDRDLTYRLVENLITCKDCRGRGDQRINEQQCPTCTGLGFLLDKTAEPTKTCPYCDGTGRFQQGEKRCLNCNSKGWVFANRIPCQECKSKGIIYDTIPCETCNATGKFSVGVLLDLNSLRNSARERSRQLDPAPSGEETEFYN